MTYDEHGRVFQHFDMTGDHWGVQYVYNNRGYLSDVMDARYEDEAERIYYSTAQEMDALGNVAKELMGNGVTRNRTYNAGTGRLEHIGGSKGAIFNRQDLSMTYDLVGNLTSRRDQRESYDLKESFCYDNLNRLIKTQAGTVSGACAGLNASNGDIRYDALGNIVFKQGVGAYTYGSSRPHAVTQAGSASYAYDANGNSVQAMAFDPWGRRRNAADWPTLLALYQPGWDTSHTTRGYTGHEQLDALGLVHMNGRIYDPHLGRFLQAVAGCGPGRASGHYLPRGRSVAPGLSAGAVILQFAVAHTITAVAMIHTIAAAGSRV